MPIDVTSPETIRQMAQAARQSGRDIDFGDAVFLWDSLASLRATIGNITDEQVLADAKDLMRHLFLVVLPAVSDREALEMFDENCVFMIDQVDIDVNDLIRRKLVNMPFIEDRDEYRRKFRDVLTRNGAALTQKPPAGAPQGSVGDWVRVYLRLNQENDSLKQAQFLIPITSTGSEFTSEEQGRIERLIKLFDYLRLSSAAEGFEEQSIADLDGKWVTFENGRPAISEPVRNKQVRALREEFKMHQAVGAAHGGPIEAAADAYRTAHPTKLEDDLAFVVRLSGGQHEGVSIEQAIAALQHVCEEMSIHDVVTETGDDSLRSLFESVLVDSLGQSNDFAAAVAGRTIARMKPEDRAAHAHEAYYDMALGKFVWGDKVIIPLTP